MPKLNLGTADRKDTLERRSQMKPNHNIIDRLQRSQAAVKIYEIFPERYKGLAKEAITYSTYFALPKREPSIKFVILTQGRSGSDLLVSLLDSHPQIHCAREPLRHRLLFPKLYLKCYTNLSPRDVFGFKLIVYQFNNVQRIEDPVIFMADLYDLGFKIIYLKRRNTLRIALSVYYSLHRGTWVSKESDGKPKHTKMAVDFRKLFNKMEAIDRFRILEEKILEKLPHMKIVYEDDLLDNNRHQSTVDRIANFLGVSPASVDTNYVRITTDEISSFVANIDELRDSVRGTKYEKYLSL